MTPLNWMISNNRWTEIQPTFDRRHELKFSAARVGISELETLLSTSLTRAFPNRQVHSVYFDTPGLALLHESEEGLNPRTKYRVRWYDGLAQQLTIEIKRSESLSRLKSSHQLPLGTDLPTCLHTRRGMLVPTALVSYERQYLSCDTGRVTIDTNISTTALPNGRVRHHHLSVAEFKAPFSKVDINADYSRVFSTDRFSKYSLALRQE